MATFQERLRDVLGPAGYKICMRRSIQSVILYEAHRCLKPKLPSLKIFQRKAAFLEQARTLLRTLDFIADDLKSEVMWRTGTSREQLTPEAAWKRFKLIERELRKFEVQIKPYMEGNSHAEACDLLVQELSENAASQENANGTAAVGQIKNRSPDWIHAHSNVWLVFRLYYDGDRLDPTFPDPQPLREIVVPKEKSKPGDGAVYISVPIKDETTTGYSSIKNEAQDQQIAPRPAPAVLDDAGTTESRKRILLEVREHLDLLKEFEGVVPQEELNQRKRELFVALPPVPPPYRTSIEKTGEPAEKCRRN